MGTFAAVLTTFFFFDCVGAGGLEGCVGAGGFDCVGAGGFERCVGAGGFDFLPSFFFGTRPTPDFLAFFEAGSSSGTGADLFLPDDFSGTFSSSSEGA